MKQLLVSILILCIGTQFIHSQNNNILTINGEGISKEEFLAIYNKNRNVGEEINQRSLEEYMDLFINFKLKVKEAESLGLDTLSSFINELAGYRKQLAAPYLIDKQVNINLLKEAYNRLKEEVRASHILISLSPDALPKDTLDAYNLAIEVREKFKKGEEFSLLAQTYSGDPSVKDNDGDLGYFTGLYMVYPFENGAYNTTVGDISMPVRTQFGYHLIYVTDRRTAQGQIKVAHIMVKTSQDADITAITEAENKILEIYNKLEAGNNFSKICLEYSDDKKTSQKGGELPWFGTGMMFLPFEESAYSITEIGNYSQPIRTPIGFHIIKLIDKKDISSFEEMTEDLTKKIKRDSRSELSIKSVVNRLKNEYEYKEFSKSKTVFYDLLDNSFFTRQWKIDSTIDLSSPIFILDGIKVNQKLFSDYILLQQRRNYQAQPITSLVDFMFEQFSKEYILNYEESLLEKKYPEFKALMKEYHDGILLFELTDQMVWSKAVQDTLGLKEFYDRNTQNYMWDKRVYASLVKTKNNFDALRVKYYLKTNKNDEYILNKMNNNIEKISLNSQYFSIGDDTIVDSIPWIVGLHNIPPENNYQFVVIHNVLNPEPKKIEEARGVITSDYQTYLEKLWVATLREKYNYIINNDLLTKLKNNLE